MILDRLIAPRSVMAATPGPIDDFWYGPAPSTVSTAGVRVTADAALRIGVAWRCVGILSDSIGQLPLHVYRRLANGGKERMADHPLDLILSDSPNGWQTSVEWRTQGQLHLLLRGNSYSQIVGSGGRFVAELRPLDPGRMRDVRLENGRMRYKYDLPETHRQEEIQPDELLHVRGMSLDGISGLSVFAYARESLGRRLAIQEYGSRFFAQSGVPPGYLSTDQTLTREQAKDIARNWSESRSGLAAAHRVAVLGQGTKFATVGINPEDAQLLQADETTAYEVCSWFGVPPHMAGLVSRSTSWGTGIEQQTLGFAVFTLAGWASRWEQRINRDLLMPEERRAGIFVEHNMAGLLRGDMKGRSEYYKRMRELGAYSINDILRKENENEIEADWADKHIVPLNFRDADQPAPTKVQPSNSRAEALARAAAQRVVRKELAAMRQSAAKYGANLEGWRSAVGEYYSNHAVYVIDHLQIGRHEAEQYCKAQADALIEDGAVTMMDWESRRVEDLVSLALGERRAA